MCIETNRNKLTQVRSQDPESVKSVRRMSSDVCIFGSSTHSEQRFNFDRDKQRETQSNENELIRANIEFCIFQMSIDIDYI